MASLRAPSWCASHRIKGGETGARAFGIYHSAIEFTAIARSLEHPYDYFAAVPDVLLSWMALYLGRGPVWVARYRLRKIMAWRELAKGLEQKEAELHASLEPGVREILKGKRLLLLERLAGEIGWPDKCLHSDICNGFALVGLTKPSHVFPKDVTSLCRWGWTSWRCSTSSRSLCCGERWLGALPMRVSGMLHVMKQTRNVG